jgi:hypothetical protein
MNRSLRGLTLLEVVIAISLLTSCVVALAPVLVKARRAIAPAASTADPYDLTKLADTIREAPKTPLPDGLTVERVKSRDPSHDWLLVRQGRELRLRAVPASKEPPR